MNKLFKIVKCSDRLPTEQKMYIAYDEDIDYWEEVMFIKPTQRWGTESDITHWLELITLPTEEEVEQARDQIYNSFFVAEDEADKNMWDLGFAHCKRWIYSF